MAAVFQRGNLRFLYPENWQLEESQSEGGWSVALQSPETAFMTIAVYPDRPAVKEVLETTLSVLREDYPDLEAEDAAEKIADHPAQGYDIQFFSLDFTNTCWTRSFRTANETVLILCQATDAEVEYMRPVLRAILASLELVEE